MEISDYDQLFPNRFLKAGLFAGRQVTLTIKGVALEQLPDRKKKKDVPKAVLSFREREMELVLNKTNGERLKGMFGRKPLEWIGKRVTFAPMQVEAFGGTTLAIRVIGSPDIPRDMEIDAMVGGVVSKVRMRATGAKASNGKAPTPPPEREAPMADADGMFLGEEPPEDMDLPTL